MADIALQRWKRGDRFSASHLNEAVDVCRELTHLGGNGISVIRTPGGTAFSLQDKIDFSKAYFGQVRRTGLTGGLVDFADERYWIYFQYINDADSHAQIIPEDDPPAKDTFSGSNLSINEYPVVATNIAELVGHTHNIPDNTPIVMFRFLDHQTPAPVHHWVFTSGGTASGTNNLVVLSQTGGSGGTNPANWTYTATDIISGATLGTVLSPTFRPSGVRTAATRGLGYTNAGTFTLVYAFEDLAPGSDYMVLQFQSSKVVTDWVRLH